MYSKTYHYLHVDTTVGMPENYILVPIWLLVGVFILSHCIRARRDIPHIEAWLHAGIIIFGRCTYCKHFACMPFGSVYIQ